MKPNKLKRAVGRPRVALDSIPLWAGSLREAESIFHVPRDILLWARDQGCPAFRGHRVHRSVIDWLKRNPPSAALTQSLEEKGVLERERLRRINRNLDLKYEVDAGLRIPKAEVMATWAAGMEVVMSTAQAFLPKDRYNAWARELKSRLLKLDR